MLTQVLMFLSLSYPDVKLSIILNANPCAVKDNEKVDMINIICTYIKKAYVFD